VWSSAATCGSKLAPAASGIGKIVGTVDGVEGEEDRNLQPRLLDGICWRTLIL
jgi:hypothetical protein